MIIKKSIKFLHFYFIVTLLLLDIRRLHYVMYSVYRNYYIDINDIVYLQQKSYNNVTFNSIIY